MCPTVQFLLLGSQGSIPVWWKSKFHLLGQKKTCTYAIIVPPASFFLKSDSGFILLLLCGPTTLSSGTWMRWVFRWQNTQTSTAHFLPSISNLCPHITQKRLQSTLFGALVSKGRVYLSLQKLPCHSWTQPCSVMLAPISILAWIVNFLVLVSYCLQCC